MIKGKKRGRRKEEEEAKKQGQWVAKVVILVCTRGPEPNHGEGRPLHCPRPATSHACLFAQRLSYLYPPANKKKSYCSSRLPSCPSKMLIVMSGSIWSPFFLHQSRNVSPPVDPAPTSPSILNCETLRLWISTDILPGPVAVRMSGCHLNCCLTRPSSRKTPDFLGVRSPRRGGKVMYYIENRQKME